MAKDRKITRTIKEHIITVMCINPLNGEVKDIVVRVTGELPDTSKLLKEIQTEYNTEITHCIYIKGIATTEYKYQLSERKFIEYGEKVNND